MYGLVPTYSSCVTITGSDTVPQHFGALVCLSTGNVTIRAASSTSNVTFTGVAAGVIIPIETQLVLLTGITGVWGGLA